MIRQLVRHYAAPVVRISSKIEKFDQDAIKEATERGNRLLKAIQESQQSEHEYQRAANLKIEEARKSGYAHVHGNTEMPEIPEDPRLQADLLKSQQLKTHSSRYVYNKQEDRVIDRLRVLQKERKLPSLPRQNQYQQFWGELERFAAVLVLKNETPAVSLTYKALADSLEAINILQNAHLDHSVTDPNDFTLAADYFFTRKIQLLLQKLQPVSELSELDNVALVGLTHVGFKETTNPLQLFTDKFKDSFSVVCCTLNRPQYPELTQLNQPDDNTKKNFYQLATLGLTKVVNLPDGWIVLTKGTD
ncbi:hypothetical protein KL925_000610 [Ogataea polymorpha]|uniref:uncharacterized protein n=1 Tax=Ogataea polymorpha TaxID=460523 RepID=UPI0007F4C659|nr:uncharacterized protein OGAPODRAFT_94632 [Ogataea polymorpha]KAG7896220.1 hypothetical protein KL908_000734 [Ogataea polymorpha]KAG7904020.1 hypothetical protein KL935_000159 [Ogataea polymorpha]KAG7929868.1 hypothetical protein KL925_000610 [Ogataea polymorpha]KAG7939451.1 hypothetical protein KL934_000385 [Ogataea polymorpha]OBA14776.1 hypothetical protein OGAPODRAFT_94632 [Ogataea polymorpha]